MINYDLRSEITKYQRLTYTPLKVQEFLKNA